MAEGTDKKLKGGTIGKSLSASHTFYEMTFATSQKKEVSLVTIIFFEAIDKLRRGISSKLLRNSNKNEK